MLLRLGVDIEVLEAALQKWGREKQLAMLEEEAQELALAVHKLLNRQNDRETTANVIDEVADVYIMILQAMLIFGQEKVISRVNYKLSRLEFRLQNNIF